METVLKPSHGNRNEGPILSSTETVPLSRVSQGGCGGSIRIHEAHAATQPARLPWPAPRFRELDPVTEDPIGSWSPLLSNAPPAGSAQLTVDVLTRSAFSTAHVH
jgi:hypothetical protein